MINEIEIAWFQCWKYALLELSPGLNAVVGPSDQGKSALFRSIEWCYKNDPPGLEFRSWSAGKNDLSRSTISMDDDRWATRERNESINRYSLYNVEDPLEAFGQGPVKEVQEIFNFSDFAIRGQYDQYFLLQSSSGEVSRILNSLTGLSVSDDVIKKVNSIIHKTRSGIDNAEERIEQLQEEIKELAYLDQLEIELGRLEKALKERELAREERRLLVGYSRQLEDADRKIQEWDEWLEVEVEAQELINQTQDLNLIVKEKKHLGQIISQLERIDEDIRDFDEEVRDYERAVQLQKDMKVLYHEKDDLRILKECTERLDDLETVIVAIDLDVKELQAEKEKYGIICQKCGARVEI